MVLAFFCFHLFPCWYLLYTFASVQELPLQRPTWKGPVLWAAQELVLQAAGGSTTHRQKCPSLLQVSPIQWCACWLWFRTANHLSSSVYSLLCNGKLTTSTSPFQAASAARTASVAVVLSSPWQCTVHATTKSTDWSVTVRQGIKAAHIWVTPSVSHLHPHQKLPDLDLRQLLARQTCYFS